MNPDKKVANFHTLVLTENKPEDAFIFEETYDKKIREKYQNTTVFIKYIHGIGEKINDFNHCLNLMSKSFYEPGSTTFSIKKVADQASGNLVIMSWKNPATNRIGK